MLQLLRLNSILLKLGRNLANRVKKSTSPAKSKICFPVVTRTNSENYLCIRTSGASFLEKIRVAFSANHRYWTFLFFLLFCSSFATAAPVKKQATFTEYLTQERAHLTAAIQDAKKPIQLKSEKEFSAKMKQVSAILSMTSVKITSLENFLEHQNKEQNSLNQRLKQLQQMPIVKENTSIPERVEKVENLLAINKQTTELVIENLKLAKEFQASLNEEVKLLELWHSNFVLEQKLVQIKLLKEQLNKRLNILYESNSTTQQPLKRSKSSTQLTAADHEAMLLVNNQSIAAIQNHLNALNIQKTVVRADIIYLKNPDTKNLQLITDIYKDALNQYAKVEKNIRQIESFLTNETKLVVAPSLKRSISSLQKTLAQQLKEARIQKQLLVKSLSDYQTQLKNLMSSRQTLADYSISSWPIILKKIAAIPGLFYKYIKTLSLKVYDSYLWLSPLSMVILWGGFSFIAIFFFMISRILKILLRDKERSRLTGYLYDGALVLIQRNLPYFCIATMLWALLYITHISFSNYQLFFRLIAVWFTFRALILIARLVLLERITDSSGKDVKLYYRLKWLLLFGGWTAALMTIGHLLPLSILLQDIFNRLFMLFILTVSLVAWKSKDVIPYLLRPMLKSQKGYVKNAIYLLVILVPTTLFTTALIGLLGFISLAWSMSQYQAYVLLVLVGYIFARGLLFDALELFSELMISSLRNGWLWIEVFLKPLDKILRILLLLVSIHVLFQLFGWYSDSLVMISLGKFAQYTVVNIPGIHITVTSTIEFLILLAVFVWASKWTREFCYRWVFKNAKDVGIRNSLSVFSQYSIVLLGGFVSLHVLGFDFSGMSMIIGGLAVGMGFGLRDFASNVVGGLMLLVERPVREGDLVTIGEHEGRVAHIGIRSMRVSSWDNMEVLIPNAETFNKPFTNWTHQDGIVRTVVPIKVSRSDDAVMVQQLIQDILATNAEIVADPPAQVFLKKIDEALLEFEARYFINVQVHTRFEVRSKVLFAIMAQFKAANIKPPIEPLAIEIKEGESDFTVKKQTTTEN
ncbi:Miniconductance mechanosensitive channel MscM [Legionella parisiensis]|uniref:Miniconductance mechanosensitive channel MscM n=1 Tax=Legionella parisiensis TaxID=45071 RepID=A0A1E5JX80_9GAMM|nr:mechanosensitive ion channel domain-containing protein [Legionella parisiensis]OEH48688.1 Miniconductance mechanosensitive channel MscM [Legionella parisiensis]